ncbi:ferredoxin [Promicromonospora thailandica]|uniref:Ferredoxin n=1 Tax=Promicromonospora thailandica TaxID=765201 RepID=A0A9X2JWK0_9MICO|nr:ferredoxin [Promicromonospora thailandica]MCP2266221.1 Ferredoxin [Promicromonospora thailandica]BFF20707.1 ferredoxin [Promicromonospora thailandica]
MMINVDRDACCGSGQCALVAPAVFGQDENDLVVLLDARPGPEHDRAVQEAVSMCPTGVIWVDQNA